MDNKEKNLEIIYSNTVQVLPEKEIEKKIATGQKLKIKLGADPTAPDLHLGHTIVLSKLKQFQDLGHEVIFLIGDFTGRIGDPTGRDKTRVPLTEEVIQYNLQSYFDQVKRILDPNKMTVRFNSEWLGQLTGHDMVSMLAKVTLARIIARDDFEKRMKNNESIGMHELLYPLFQAFDSVALSADVELGGTDQTFNLLMGRFLQEQYDQRPQTVITMPLLIGLDGVHKMSKSLGNAIGLNEPAGEAFGKLMSISDMLMWHYFEILLGRTKQEISVLQERVASGNLHPMELKKDMAHEVLVRFWSVDQALAAREQFEALFQKHDYSKAQEVTLPAETANPIWIVDLLKILGAIKTSSEVKRLIETKAIYINEEVVTDFKAEIAYCASMIIKVGKHRIYKIK